MTNIDIGFVIDDGYVKYCSVVIASILKNSKADETFTFHIINDGSITQESKNKLAQLKHIKDFEIKYYAQNKKLHHEQRNDTRADIPMVTNYRMMISSILKDIDKIIFMDADLIIVDSLSELWNTNIDNYYMACCPSTEEGASYYQRSLDIPDNYKYCNTGVMLANLKLWRQNHIEDLLFEKEKKYRGIYKYYDQCIFNITLYDKILYLNQKFNFRPAVWDNKKALSKFHKDKNNPVIIHWASPYKPWNNKNVKHFDDYKKYTKLTPFYNDFKELYKELNKNARKELVQNLFSIKNQTHKFKKYKVITLAGVKIKIHKKSKLEKLLARKYDPNLSLDDKKYIIEHQFEQAVGYKPNIDNPKSFNEKLQWLKLYNEDPLLTKCADKYLVRDYVKEKIGEEYLIPLLGVWDSPDEIDFDKLPEQFVLKVNWGSGQNIIVKDKSKLDIKEAKAKLKEWLKPHSNHYYFGFEWCYKNIQPKIIAEKYIEQIDGNLLDYKIFCNNGNPSFLFVGIDRHKDLKFNFYDLDFNLLPFKQHYDVSNKKIPKPECFQEMLNVAKKLSKDFLHARIDLFLIGNKIYFGEITFYHFNGLEAFEPVEWDYKLGEMLTLPASQNGGGGQGSVPDSIQN